MKRRLINIGVFGLFLITMGIIVEGIWINCELTIFTKTIHTIFLCGIYPQVCYGFDRMIWGK